MLYRLVQECGRPLTKRSKGVCQLLQSLDALPIQGKKPAYLIFFARQTLKPSYLSLDSMHQALCIQMRLVALGGKLLQASEHVGINTAWQSAGQQFSASAISQNGVSIARKTLAQFCGMGLAHAPVSLFIGTRRMAGEGMQRCIHAVHLSVRMQAS